MPHNPALDALNEVLRQAQATGAPHNLLTADIASQILSPPPALPAPSIHLHADRCELLWAAPADASSYLALTAGQDGTVKCALHTQPDAVPPTTGTISTSHAGWPVIVRGYIALVARAGIISPETVSLSAAPNLLQFCRAVTAVVDLSQQLQIPSRRQWPAIEAMLTAYWPDWDCPRIPDGITSSPGSQLIINLMDPAEPEGQFPKWILNTLLAACRLADTESGEPAETTAEIHSELQAWAESAQPKGRRDLGVILHTAEALLGHLNSRSPDQLSQPMPEREPPLTLEAFRQELTLAVPRTHQAGIRPIAPGTD